MTSDPTTCPPAELAIVVPTFNELENIEEVVTRVDRCLAGIRWELIFVDDDSPDGTTARVRELARVDTRVRGIQRVGRRGLSTACIEGMLATAAPFVAVMDADLQHDETLLPEMLAAIKADDLDLVVGSRYTEGGSVGDWSSDRAAFSRLATRLGQRLLRVELSDPMSGFFMLRREVLDACVHRLSGVGFKILLDIFSSMPRKLEVRELPYTFRQRHAGESKLDSAIAWEFLMMLLDKTLGRYVPVRFLVFSLIGGLGVVVHMVVLWGLFKGMQTSFTTGHIAATLVAMTSNFFLDNLITYRDMRLVGRQLITGWISFVMACSIGALANVGIAVYLFGMDTYWILSAVAGILVGAVWNYAVTAAYTWRRFKKNA